LKDVSFDVHRGEVVGIIGRNGAGKSTLLKILSQITEPTEGEASILGRVGSLLEVGTGFNPELTGRENIFLNGAILGMRRAEIIKKFDDIVSFGEVEKFVDTPVKHYSSGMQMRLGFAVAAHLEPEILVVDEVLAVGDAGFQKKCLGKMGDVARGGRTVLFVSHNMAAVQGLCNRAILLDHGRVADEGDPRAMVAAYLRVMSEAPQSSLTDFRNRTGNFTVLFDSFHVEDEAGSLVTIVQSGQTITFVFRFHCAKGPVRGPVNVGFGLHLPTGERLTILYASHTGQEFDCLPERGEFRCAVPRFPFNPGRYFMFPRIEVGMAEADFPRDGVGYFDVDVGDFYGTGRQTLDRSPSPFLIDGKWQMREDVAPEEVGS
jgi:lipopolysaccharide transport system ATP-binding protein